MSAVTISSKFQVVIPRAVRESLGLAAGQKVEVIALDGRIELILVRPARKLRGVLRGIDATVEREPDSHCDLPPRAVLKPAR